MDCFHSSHVSCFRNRFPRRTSLHENDLQEKVLRVDETTGAEASQVGLCCYQTWQNSTSLAKFKKCWATFRGIVSIQQTFEPNLSTFEPNLSTFMPLWQFFDLANGQILKNNLAIWSHWSLLLPSLPFGLPLCLSIESLGNKITTYFLFKTLVAFIGIKIAHGPHLSIQVSIIQSYIHDRK